MDPTTGHGREPAIPIAQAHCPADRRSWRLPGVPNLHSHAFQRAMAGLAERQMDPEDSFWTWRETMYRMAARFDPDSLHAVAAQLYAEMLEAGYTAVCEFHYLHHAPDGTRYADPGAMSRALVQAARDGRLGVAQSICGRVRDLGGTVDVHTAPGQGTEVELRVPR